MPPHDLPVGNTDFLQRIQVFLLVEHVPRQPDDVLGLAVRFFQYGNYVEKRLAKLAGKAFCLPFALPGPADLPCNEDQAAPAGNPVGKSLLPRPPRWLQYPHHDDFLSFKRSSFPGSLRSNAPTNSTAPGAWYAAIVPST